MLRVINRSKAELIAFAFSVGLQGGPVPGEFRQYYDAAIDWPTADFAAPDKSVTVPVAFVAGPEQSNTVPRMRATVFADGSILGEPEWIDALKERRRRCSVVNQKIARVLEQRLNSSSSYDETLADLARIQAVIDEQPLDEFRLVEDRELRAIAKTLELSKKRRVSTTRAFSIYSRHLQEKQARLQRMTLQQPEGKYHVQPPRLPWGDVFTKVVDHAGADVGRSHGLIVPAVLRVGESRKISSKPPRIRLATIWSCYFEGFGKEVVSTDGCNNTTTTRDLHFGIGAWDPITDTRVVYQYYIGEYVAYGACWSYINCDGYSESDERVGDANLFGPQVWGNSTRVAALLDVWQGPPTSLCDCEDPYPEGLNVGDPVKNPYLTGMVYLLSEQTGFCSPS